MNRPLEGQAEKDLYYGFSLEEFMAEVKCFWIDAREEQLRSEKSHVVNKNEVIG